MFTALFDATNAIAFDAEKASTDDRIEMYRAQKDHIKEDFCGTGKQAGLVVKQHNDVDYFLFEGHVFTNFYEFDLEIEGMVFKSSEHAFQMTKCAKWFMKARNDEEKKTVLQVLAMLSLTTAPTYMITLSRMLPSIRPGGDKSDVVFISDEWQKVSLPVLEHIIRRKVELLSDIAKMVKSMRTQSANPVFLECNKHDPFWGMNLNLEDMETQLSKYVESGEVDVKQKDGSSKKVKPQNNTGAMIGFAINNNDTFIKKISDVTDVIAKLRELLGMEYTQQAIEHYKKCFENIGQKRDSPDSPVETQAAKAPAAGSA